VGFLCSRAVFLMAMAHERASSHVPILDRSFIRAAHMLTHFDHHWPGASCAQSIVSMVSINAVKEYADRVSRGLALD